MTRRKDELIQALRELAKFIDPEEAHRKADELLLAYIGDKEISKAFRGMVKWYA